MSKQLRYEIIVHKNVMKILVNEKQIANTISMNTDWIQSLR